MVTKIKSAEEKSRSDAEKVRGVRSVSRTVAPPQPANGLLGFQQVAGNQAVQRFLQYPKVLPREPEGERGPAAGEHAILWQKQPGPVGPAPAPAPVPGGSTDVVKAQIRSTIRYFEAAAKQYEAGSKVDESRMGRTVASWGHMLMAAESLIDTRLGGDEGLRKSLSVMDRLAGVEPNLRGQVRRVYRRALEALIRQAVLQLKKPSLALYRMHQSHIPEWAWPRTVADPAGDYVSDALPEAARQRIKVRRVNVPREVIDRAFPKRTGNVQSYHPLPKSASVRYGGDVIFWMRPLLEELAGLLIPHTLRPNTTLTLDLDLVHLGLGHSAYRFTYVDFHPSQGERLHQVVIEHLGAVGLDQAAGDRKEPRQKRFDRLGFTRDASWSDDNQFVILLEALERIPDGLLVPLKGLRFERAASHPDGAAGTYDPGAHAITMYDVAFEGSATRFGDVEHGLMSSTHQAIIHEVGHALDHLPLRKQWARVRRARSRLKKEFKPYESPPGSGHYEFPASKQLRWRFLKSKLTAAQKAVRRGSLVSGAHYQKVAGKLELVQGSGAGKNEFRKAAEKDGGLRITDYSEKDWGEYFAEAFSFYIADPEALKRLRPNVYTWFAKRYPK